MRCFSVGLVVCRRCENECPLSFLPHLNSSSQHHVMPNRVGYRTHCEKVDTFRLTHIVYSYYHNQLLLETRTAKWVDVSEHRIAIV